MVAIDAAAFQDRQRSLKRRGLDGAERWRRGAQGGDDQEDGGDLVFHMFGERVWYGVCWRFM